MRLLFITILAFVSTTMLGLLYPSKAVRLQRFAGGESHGRCQHCRMNEVTHSALLCTYCYWNLPGSRLEQYMQEH